MALKKIVCLAVLVSALGCAGMIGEPQPREVEGIDPNDVGLTLEVALLDDEIEYLEQFVGSTPPKIESEKQRAIIVARWSSAVERASRLMNVDLKNPELMARTGDLFRMGHNLNVPDASAFADRTLKQCLFVAPEHVECYYTLARLYLALPPRFTEAAERLINRARILIEPEKRPEFEQTLASVYLAQGRERAALRQIDVYLELRPDDEEALRIRKELAQSIGRDS